MQKTWITFTEVVELLGLVRRTAERRVALFRKRNPELHSAICRSDGNKNLYLYPDIAHYIGKDPRLVGRELTADEILEKVLVEDDFKVIEPQPDVEKNPIWDGFNSRDMNAKESEYYESITSSKDRDNFKRALEVLDLYLCTSNTIELACRSKGITARTFSRWSKKMSYLSELYSKVKTQKKQWDNDELRDLHVLNLMKIAEGYDVELKTIYFRIKEDSDGILKREPYKLTISTKHVPANPRASIFWLRNKLPEEFPYGISQ